MVTRELMYSTSYQVNRELVTMLNMRVTYILCD